MVPENYSIHIPEAEVGGTFAVGASVTNSTEVVTLDFLADVGEETYQVVRRIRLAPSALDGLYLELGAAIEARTGFTPGRK